MNRVDEISFLHSPIKLSRNERGGIDRICLNDICSALKRNRYMIDGTAIRKCPSAKLSAGKHAKDIFADSHEVTEFIRWIAGKSKILSPVCRDLLDLLENLPRAGDTIPCSPDDCAKAGNDEAGAQTVAFDYSGNRITVEIRNGRYMANATEMAKPFEKRPGVWLKLADTVKLRQSLVDDGICGSLESQVMTTRGHQGATWFDIHLCGRFAQWLSPAFACWFNKKIAPLTGSDPVAAADEPSAASENLLYPLPGIEVTDLPQTYDAPVPVNYEEALRVIGKQKKIIDKEREFLRQNRYKLDHYEATVETQEWFTTTMIANELRTSAIKLNWFLMDEGMQVKVDDEWRIDKMYRHLRCVRDYKWLNPRTKYINTYKIDCWNPRGREFIIDLWKRKNG